jgi:transposase-like protein
MYDIEFIKDALKLLKKYDYKFTKTSRELGISSMVLRTWYKKKLNKQPLLKKTRNRKSKWSNEFKKEIVNYYFLHGEKLIDTYRKFKEPSYVMLYNWVKKDKRYKQKHFVNKKLVRYTEEEKNKILVEVASRNGSIADIAKEHDITATTIFLWRKELTDGLTMKNLDNLTKEELIAAIEKLKKNINNWKWKTRF